MNLLSKARTLITLRAMSTDTSALKSSFYELADKALIGGDRVEMSDYKGKVLCVVNVASK